MNYLKVPDSNIKLTDGSIVILARFPGTKWVVHYGWYDYASRRGMGWYFSSIPAQTTIPVTPQDLLLITLVEPGTTETSDLPRPPCPPGPCPPQLPEPVPPGPKPPRPCPPGPKPPWPPVPGPVPPYPPDPDAGIYPAPPDPDVIAPPGDPRAFFSKNDQFLLDGAFVTLPSMKYRDALPTVCNIPDGKIVKINNVDGVTRYYSWNSPDQRWDEKFFENDPDDYYTKEEIDAFITPLVEADATLELEITAETTARENADAEINASLTALTATVQELSGDLDATQTLMNDELASIKSRIVALENAVFNIGKIVAEHNNTVLVSSEGTLKDSDVSIGDDEIGEPSQYADAKTLATEKAVAKKVEDSITKWSLL